VLAGINACGQKGALYLPDEKVEIDKNKGKKK